MVAVIAAAIARPAHAAPRSDAAIEAECRPYFHEACSQAIGRWLPGFGFASDWWDGATRTGRRDEIVYEGKRGSAAWRPRPDFSVVGPKDGTAFVYGDAGPPKGQVVYDYVHRVAFFDQGCCSWHDVVLAAGCRRRRNT